VLPLLWCLSLVFRVAVGGRLLCYRLGLLKRLRLPGKTWSVGNIAVGGTGKSPVTISLAEMLLSTGARPAILTRGYGAPIARGDCLILRSGQLIRPASSTNVIPDEARMQSAVLQNIPVIAGPDRVSAAKVFLNEFPDYRPTHWLLDDGFQHLKIERDLDIVLLDAKNPLPSLMPLATAREPARSLRRANLVVFTRSSESYPSDVDLTKVRSLVRTGTPILKTEMRTASPTMSVDGSMQFDPLQHTPAGLVSGIAEPKQLIDAVTAMGITVGETLSLRDHQPIPGESLVRLAATQKSVLTTAKDYWRDPTIFERISVPVFILDLEVFWGQSNLKHILNDYI